MVLDVIYSSEFHKFSLDSNSVLVCVFSHAGALQVNRRKSRPTDDAQGLGAVVPYCANVLLRLCMDGYPRKNARSYSSSDTSIQHHYSKYISFNVNKNRYFKDIRQCRHHASLDKHIISLETRNDIHVHECNTKIRTGIEKALQFKDIRGDNTKILCTLWRCIWPDERNGWKFYLMCTTHGVQSGRFSVSFICVMYALRVLLHAGSKRKQYGIGILYEGLTRLNSLSSIMFRTFISRERN